MGSNMAENHPVAFQWVTEAQERGATVFHVDPRFTRTSALSDRYVPLRAGADTAFLGGLINYILDGDHLFHDYVVHYTNAARIISEDVQLPEDLDGLFSGYDPDTPGYDDTSWQYTGLDVPVVASAGKRGREALTGDEEETAEEAGGQAFYQSACTQNRYHADAEHTHCGRQHERERRARPDQRQPRSRQSERRQDVRDRTDREDVLPGQILPAEVHVERDVVRLGRVAVPAEHPDQQEPSAEDRREDVDRKHQGDSIGGNPAARPAARGPG
jgi:anaerobic selenocysteine-containing dehydrogenase